MSEGKSEGIRKAIKTFIHHVESLENSDKDGFGREYELIQEAQMRNHRDSVCSMDVGKLENNLKKNRYKDIVPYDDHRIVLSVLDGDHSSDYINASRIVGVRGTGDYIASQGPLSGTVNDFWRMIWEYNVEIIIMACRLVEMKKIKCTQYWPGVGMSAEFGNITVFTESEEEIMTDCIRRTLRATKGKEVHYLSQFHYCGWPDHGIPENLGDIRDTISTMRQIRQNSNAPLLIHCSAGCGRTGAIIAIDYVWTLLEHGMFDETFSLFDLICNLREQRMSLVQTPDQYALVNKVLKTLCEEWLAKMASHTYENVQFIQEHSSVGDSQKTGHKEVSRQVHRSSIKLASPAALSPPVISSTTPKGPETAVARVVKKELETQKSQHEKPQTSAVSTVDVSRRKPTVLATTSLPAQSQKPQEPTDKNVYRITKKWSSLKSHSTTPASFLTQNKNTTRPEDTVLYSCPSKSMSVRASPHNKVYDLARRPDIKSMMIQSVHGATGRSSSTSDSDIQDPRQTRVEHRGKFQASQSVVTSANPKYAGFVLLNSRKSSGGSQRRQPKQQ